MKMIRIAILCVAMLDFSGCMTAAILTGDVVLVKFEGIGSFYLEQAHLDWYNEYRAEETALNQKAMPPIATQDEQCKLATVWLDRVPKVTLSGAQSIEPIMGAAYDEACAGPKARIAEAKRANAVALAKVKAENRAAQQAAQQAQRRALLNEAAAEWDRERAQWYSSGVYYDDGICPIQNQITQSYFMIKDEETLAQRSGIVDMTKRRRLHAGLIHLEKQRKQWEDAFKSRLGRSFKRSRCKGWSSADALQRSRLYKYDPYCRNDRMAFTYNGRCLGVNDFKLP